MTYTTEPVFGAYLYFNYNFTSSVRQIQDFGQEKFQVTRPPDGRLEDQSHTRLAADINSMSFSQNGQWMVVSMPNVAMLRVNLQTFEVLPFASGFDYLIGLDPAPKTAITNDGRYAIVASKNFSRFKIYDLSTCSVTPAVIHSPASCQSRDLYSFIQQSLPGYSFIGYGRFLDDDALTGYASYSIGNTTKTTRFIISDSRRASQINYLALGDSYISGEGAFDYQSGTDTNTNKCHISLMAYPYLLGNALSFNSYHSVACSGAITNDITNSSPGYIGQANHEQKITREKLQSSGQEQTIFESFLPGYINQLDFVSRYQPKVINLSIGGNDMGFSTIVKSCAMSIGTCYNSYEDRLELVRLINNQIFPKLVHTYQQIKNAGPPDTQLYVVGYPQIAKPDGNCAVNVRLNSDELIFSEQLIAYFDSVMKAAAAKAGVGYIDVQDAFNRHRLCEAGPGSIAMNGLTAGNDRPASLGGPIGDESFHPNSFGHQLLENAILASTHNLAISQPAPDLSAAPPSESGLEILNVARSGRVVNVAEYDPSLAVDQVKQGSTIDISIDGAGHALPSQTVLIGELHSSPTPLGVFPTDSNGNLAAKVTIPNSVEPGYHTLHFYGTDLLGQPIDIFKYIYILSAGDNPSVGSSNSNQPTSHINFSGGISVDATGSIGGSNSAKNQSQVLANSSPRIQQPVPPAVESDAQVLDAETSEPLPVNRFNPGWLLAALPAVLSILFFLKQD